MISMDGCTELMSLTHLDMSHNMLDLRTVDLTQLTRLTHISIAQDTLISLGHDHVSGLPVSTQHLLVTAAPQLSSLQSGVFDSLPHLTSLIITDNPLLSSLSFHLISDHHSGLRLINLTNNSLTTLHHNSLPLNQV